MRRRRANATVSRYIAQRDAYAGASQGVLSSAGRVRSREALLRLWEGPRRRLERPTDARIFCALAASETSFPLAPEIQRNFDATIFDAGPFLPQDGTDGQAWRARLQTEMLRSFASAQAAGPVDLALVYLNAYHLDTASLQKVTAGGTPVAVLALDDKHKYRERQRALIPAVTVYLTNSIETIRWYEADGGRAYYFPEASDPEIFRPLPIEKDIGVSFVGSWYGGRQRLIETLRSTGIEVECFGPGTEHGAISREEMVRVFNRSKVNLGYGGVGDTETLSTLKARDFDVPMSGNAYLTLYDWELARLYRIGEEILCYRNEVDCAEQIRMLLEDPARMLRIGAAGRARAVADHTWTRRLSDLLRWMNIVGDR